MSLTCFRPFTGLPSNDALLRDSSRAVPPDERGAPIAHSEGHVFIGDADLQPYHYSKRASLPGVTGIQVR